MFDFLLQKSSVKNAQRFIDKQSPKVNIIVPDDIPLPSIRLLKKFIPAAATINGLESKFETLDDIQLQAKTKEFREKFESATRADKKKYLDLKKKVQDTIDHEKKEEVTIQFEKSQEQFRKTKQEFLLKILPEAFAVVREAGKRVLNMRHYDVQMIGGMVLNGGNIAEMTTGEGKTLVATLPSYLNALTGEGVHVVTVNDYLAKRDKEWMGRLFEFLGLTVGVILHDMVPTERQKAYACDITYGTNNEFGFDYLRDNMVIYKEDMVQREHHFCVVDEVDSILVDEARTPLIISGPAEVSTDKYYRANEIGKQLKGRRITEKDEVDAKYQEVNLGDGYDYLADEKNKSVTLTEDGEGKAAQLFGVDNLHDMDTVEYRHHVLQALKAKEFFTRDVDYVVNDGEIVIVDEFTGRMMPGRRWSDGLHQAVEASEGIKIERENQTLATITFQNYFRLYEKLSGMTGTANTEATEFKEIYDLDCVVVPTNRKLKRINNPDSIYKNKEEKLNAVVEDIARVHELGQPVLVGTISIEQSEHLSRLLSQKGVPHKVLNAKFHENEAHIIAQAGRLGSVTIATNMAGRGTDIVLGGNPEFLAESIIDEKLKKGSSDVEIEVQTQKFIEQFKGECQKESREVLDRGGLYVLGTERHESRRIDNQLRGRQGRQGDPGESRFYVSLEDDLMRLFASDRIVGLMDKMGMEDGQALEHPWLSKALENAQRRVEGHNFEIRKHLLEYDNVMNKQREVIYTMRREILESENIKHVVLEAIEDTLDLMMRNYIAANDQDEREADIDGLDLYLKTKFLVALSEEQKKSLEDMNFQEAFTKVLEWVYKVYDAKEQQIGAEHLRHIERMLMLNTIDTKWKEHLYAMDQMKEGVGLRAHAQRDPLIEFKKEGFAMFEVMYDSINQEVAEIIFKIQPRESGPSGNLPKAKGVLSSLPQEFIHDDASEAVDPRAQSQAMPSQSQSRPQKQAPVRKEGPKVGRNDPCPCGSGKKYKKCCG